MAELNLKETLDRHHSNVNADTNNEPQPDVLDVFESSNYSHENYDTNYVPQSEDISESTNNSHENNDTNYVHPRDFSAGDNALYDINYKGNLKENF